MKPLLKPLLLACALPITVVLVTGCRQQTNAPDAQTAAPATASSPPAPAAAESEHLRTIADYMAAWNAHDADKAGSFFAEDGVYFDASVGKPQQGRQAATDNVIKVFLHAVPDAKWTMRGPAIANADGIAFEWHFSGTNTGDWSADTKATGKPLDLDGVSIVRIKDGKIAYQGDYYDAATLNKEMGW